MFTGREDFILNKRASGRTKDLADIEALGEKQGAMAAERYPRALQYVQYFYGNPLHLGKQFRRR